MRAAIYARVSTDKQRDNYSIPTQIAEILSRAKSAGYTIVGNRYIDPATGLDTQAGNDAVLAFVDDYSSREISRPGLDAALQYLETVGYDTLLVHSLDRMARDPYIRETLEREFLARGASVIYVLGNYDESAEGEVRKDLDATFAKWENAKRVERCNRGKRGKAESGKFVAGRIPFGYKKDPGAACGLVVDQQEAEVVSWIFTAYVEDDTSIREITRLLNERGIIPRMGGKWGKSSVARLLTNTVYIGHCYYNKYKRVDSKRLIERDRNEWIKIPVTPIIDNWIFRAAAEKLADNKANRRKQTTRFYLLSGKVFCSECERSFTTQAAAAGKNRRITEAQSYRHRAKEGHCSNRQVSARILEPMVWDKIKTVLLDPQTLRDGYSASLEQEEAAKIRIQAHYETLQRNQKKLQQERANLNNAYLDPDIGMTKIEYIEQKNRINDSINELNQKIEQAEKDLAKIPIPETLETIEAFADKIRMRLATNRELSREEIRQILDMLHVRVFVDREGKLKSVQGWFSKDNENGGLSPKTLLRK